jgi:hypothetical protein
MVKSGLPLSEDYRAALRRRALNPELFSEP